MSTTENAILKAQNHDFMEAFNNEKKRRKRGKQLFEELKAQDGHGATFFSPMKIQHAKDLQQQRESAKQTEIDNKKLKAEVKKTEKMAEQIAIQQAKQERYQQAAERKKVAMVEQRRKEVTMVEQRRKEVAKEVGMASGNCNRPC
ncbi:hypothetical protein LTR56_027273 [Elasticomyces elasticus]|nr:hypothetical protein LTR56_027273 [Elasticomyces elasticus]KAK3618052.1 hypothetical protein LTR22_026513 [Elasticomyces elasticus]